MPLDSDIYKKNRKKIEKIKKKLTYAYFTKLKKTMSVLQNFLSWAKKREVNLHLTKNEKKNFYVGNVFFRIKIFELCSFGVSGILCINFSFFNSWVRQNRFQIFFFHTRIETMSWSQSFRKNCFAIWNLFGCVIFFLQYTADLILDLYLLIKCPIVSDDHFFTYF